MKSPAFQFYPADFLTGTAIMTAEERGIYIALLCYQWEMGGLPDDNRLLARLAGADPDSRALAGVREKFNLCADGKLRNSRLDEVLMGQDAFFEQQRNRGVASGQKRRGDSEWGKRMAASRHKTMRTGCEPDNEPDANHCLNEPDANSPSPSSCLESIRAQEEVERPEVQRPSLAETLAYAERIGLAPWKAEDWFNEMEAGGWLDHAHRPVKKWQAMLTRVRTKWEADGRPKSPPPNNRGTGNGNNGNTRGFVAPNRNNGTANEGRHDQYRGVGKVG